MAYIDEMLNLWDTVKETFRPELPSAAFDLWLGNIKPVRFDMESKVLVFSASSEFVRDTVEKSYKQKIEDRFKNIVDIEVDVRFEYTGKPVDAEALRRRIEGLSAPAKAEEPMQDSGENAMRAKYTFDNFIEGESNRFARAVCLKVANTPYSVYNPLFIYGPSGVGKTHLMCAVINELRAQNPNVKVVYTKGDDFVNHMIRCLEKNDMETFRAKYRGCDVLLIDDIQFIAGKEATQTEVFHTFQALFDEGKQIILASDRPPKDINPLEERLRSRFEQGLLADINPPNLELRVAIIKKKAEDLDIDLPVEVLTYLSENLRSNIRQIEGAIKKLAAKSLVDGRRISLEMARDCITDLLGDAEPLDVTIEKIFAAVNKKYNIPKEDIVGKKRNKEIAFARHVAIYLIREVTEISQPHIGKIVNRDHTTVISSLELIKKRIISDTIFAADMETLKKEIEGR